MIKETVINGNRVIYGKLKDCVKEVFQMIDFKTATFPDFDFAAWVDEDLTQEDLDKASDVSDLGEMWYGVKDMATAFDADTISLMICHYGGGGLSAVEVPGNEAYYERDLIEAIDTATGDYLGERDYTVFEFIQKNQKNN